MPKSRKYMSKKSEKKSSSVVAIGRTFELKKIAAHMAAAALLTVVSTHLAAVTLSGNIDGGLSTGHLVRRFGWWCGLGRSVLY